MEKTETGLVILKTADSTVDGRTVTLTRKTNKAGEIRHGVVLTSKRSGRRYKVGTFTTISPAFKLYKALARA